MTSTLALLSLLLTLGGVESFAPATAVFRAPPTKRVPSLSSPDLAAIAPSSSTHEGPAPSLHLDRRSAVSKSIAAVLSAAVTISSSNQALADVPSVTVEEFETILRDSAKSISVVEFSGPKGETAIAKLVDGTSFSISDLIESPSDPRSPLKLVATCRSYKVPTRNLGLELALKGTEKKKKVYMNARVVEAAEKEKAKRERMAQDETERLAELYRIEEAEARAASAAEGTAVQ